MLVSNALLTIAFILLVAALARLLKARSSPQATAIAKGTVGIFYATKGGTAAKLASMLQETLTEHYIASSVTNIKDFSVSS